MRPSQAEVLFQPRGKVARPTAQAYRLCSCASGAPALNMTRDSAPLLQDVLEPNLRVVICGTALGAASAQKQQYYAGPGNRFWMILTEIGLTPRMLSPAEYPSLLDHGIGLTDIVKDQSGPDSSLVFRDAGAAALEAKLLEYQPKVLCFNGKRAAMTYLGRRTVSYGLQPENVARTQLFVAPSTSGAARRWWDPTVWKTMADVVMT